MTVDDYEGGFEIERAWREGLRPDPRLTVSEWAERYRMLSTKESAEPGRWRNARTPYLREIMDCLSPASPVERVVLMKGAQVGGTELGLNWVGYAIHHAPGPMMIVWPTTEMAQRNSKHRIDPLIEESPAQVALCPLSISVQVRHGRPGQVVLAWREPQAGSAGRQKAIALLRRLAQRTAELAR